MIFHTFCHLIKLKNVLNNKLAIISYANCRSNKKPLMNSIS